MALLDKSPEYYIASNRGSASVEADAQLFPLSHSIAFSDEECLYHQSEQSGYV